MKVPVKWLCLAALALALGNALISQWAPASFFMLLALCLKR